MWSPIEDDLTRYWNVSRFWVNALSTVFMYVYIVLALPGLFLLQKKGLRWSMIASSSLNTLGCLVRLLGNACTWCSGETRFASAYAGAFVASVAQLLILSVPPLLSMAWFEMGERNLATGLGVVANQLGTALGLGITGVVLDHLTRENLSYYILVQTFISAASICMCVTFVQDRPSSLIDTMAGVDGEAPPTYGSVTSLCTNTESSVVMKRDTLQERSTLLLSPATKEVTENPTIVDDAPDANERRQGSNDYFSDLGTATLGGFAKALIGIVRDDTNVALLTLAYGASTGVFYALATFLSQLLPKWSTSEVGYLGMTFVFAGTTGLLVVGSFLDRTQAYITTTRILFALAACSLVLWTIAASIYDHSDVLVFAAIFLAGFFLTSILSVGFEIAVEMTYTKSFDSSNGEAAIAGILNVSAQAFGCVFIWIGGAILSNTDDDEATEKRSGSPILATNVMFVGAALLASIAVCVMGGSMRRLESSVRLHEPA